jgi:transcriptional regulator with XRE-family HTH domain
MGFDEEIQSLQKRWGKQLTEYRKAKGYSAEQLAERVGLDRTMVYKIEAGQVNSLRTFAALLWECGLSFEDFLAGFRSSDIPEEHKKDFDKLKTILGSGFGMQAGVVRAALDSVYATVLELKKARAKEPAPPVSKPPPKTRKQRHA